MPLAQNESEPHVNAFWIIVAAGIVPLFWSYAVFRVLNRLWPAGRSGSGAASESTNTYHVPDYQI